VVGPVEAIDAALLQLTVLGQKVFVTDQTHGGDDESIDGPFEFANIAVGDRVAVSGHFTADGQVVATRIESGTPPGRLLLRGILTAMSNGHFAIGDQEIDLSTATLVDFPGGSPLAGDAVLLFTEDQGPGGILAPQEARYTAGNRDPNGTTFFEFNGFVTSSTSPYEFEIEGYNFSGSTLGCDSCNRLSDSSLNLPVGTLVSYFGSTGVKPPPIHTYLSLDSVPRNATILNGRIDSLDPGRGSLIVAGFKVLTSPATHISNDGAPWVGSHTLELSEYRPGDAVTVIGGIRLPPDDVLVADMIGLPDGANTRITTRHFERVDPAIIVMGRSILTDSGTTVTVCDSSGACTVVPSTWLFDNPDLNPRELTIEINTADVPMRAASILVVPEE
jgi:hypothetical protein